MADRQVFGRIGNSECVDFEAWSKQEPLKTLAAAHEAEIKDLERKMAEAKGIPRFLELSTQQAEISKGFLRKEEEVRRFLRGKLRKCLADIGMSKEGAELTTTFFLQGIAR